MSFVSSLFDFVTHLAPLVITLGFLVVVWAFFTYKNKLHYIQLVVSAKTDADAIELAKFMAKMNGGRYINTEKLWEDFVPAAKAVIYEYRNKL